MAISLVGVFGETVEVEPDLSFFSTGKIKIKNKDIKIYFWLIILVSFITWP